MCSGRVDPEFFLRAFSKGIDGVLIGGCRLNECNYQTHGNFYARNMVLLYRHVLQAVGIDPRRLRIEFMSGAEGNRFVEVCNEFVAEIQSLGPIGRAEGLDADQLQRRLTDIRRLVPYLKIANRQKMASRAVDPELVEALFSPDEVERQLKEVPVYWIDPEKCQACMICAKRCPAQAIISAKNHIHVIDPDKCIRCGTCFEACPPRFGAVTKWTGRPAPPPIPENQRAIQRKSHEKQAA